MNSPKFLSEVDGLSAGLTHDELKEFIHEVARTLPEEKRNYFINSLRLTGNSAEKARLQDVVMNIV